MIDCFLLVLTFLFEFLDPGDELWLIHSQVGTRLSFRPINRMAEFWGNRETIHDNGL